MVHGGPGSAPLPSGTVTFLFTDIESSTELWSVDEAGMAASLAQHDAVMRSSAASNGGYVFTTAGDAFSIAFDRASDAVHCAAEIQARLSGLVWDGPPIRVRIGIHLGEAEEREGDYFGLAVSKAARIAGTAHGGQVVMSEAVDEVAKVNGTALGRHQIRDFPDPVNLFQLGGDEFPPLRARVANLVRLPAFRTRLIGRETELDAVDELVRDHRLVTVVGPGGAGKTRLGVEAAERAGEHIADGIFFVDLAAISSPDQIDRTIHSALQLIAQGTKSLRQELIDYLSERSSLLVLDNCEHLIDPIAEAVTGLLDASPNLQVLATSREPLEVEGERVFHLGPLPASGRNSPAVRLFVERAQALATDAGTEPDLDAAQHICRHLDGLPLAVELAAARTTTMTAAELAQRLPDRFDLLTRGGRGRAKRQQTLRGMIDWSFDLLDDRLKRAFRRLSVFETWFRADDAGFVLEMTDVDALDQLDDLTRKSLLHSSTTPEGATRFRMLESIREYGLDQLEAADEPEHALELHRLSVVRWIDGMDYYQLDTADGFGRMDDAWPDIVAAVARSDDADRMRIAAGAARTFVDNDQIVAWMQPIDAADEMSRRDRARAYGSLAAAELMVGQLDDLTRTMERSGYTMLEATSEEEIATAAIWGWVEMYRDPRRTLEIGQQLDTWALQNDESGYLRFAAQQLAAMATLRLGHFDDCAAVCERHLADAPPGGMNQLIFAVCGVAAHQLQSRFDESRAFGSRITARADSSPVAFQFDLARALATAAPGETEDSGRALVQSYRRTSGRTARVDVTYRLAFGWLHQIEGRAQRANSLLRPSRSPTPYTDAFTVQHDRLTHGWDEGEFGERLVRLDRSTAPSDDQERQLVAEEEAIWA